MFSKQLLNNLPICLKGVLNCICTFVSIKVSVFIQKNVYLIHNYVHKSMENCFFRDKYSFSSQLLSGILLSFMENFKAGVAYKRLTYRTRANSDLDADESNFLANKTVRLLLGLYV